jgi:RNA polymerase sigma-70 factor (ECF subfamily)
MTSDVAVQAGSDISNETDLIFNARQGDLESFNQLVLHYQNRIFNLAVRILSDEHMTSGITQNTFMTAYLKLPNFHNGSFYSWLYRIATNACYDVHRFHNRHPVLSIESKEFAEEKLIPLDDFSSAKTLPEVELDRRELRRTVQAALNKLSIEYRTILVLVDQQEFNYREAANILKIPLGTVKSRLARARMRLQQLLNHTIIAYR